MADAVPPVAGVVLAGGKSSRLGLDKAEVLFRGVNLLDRAVAVVQSVVSEVWIAGRCPVGWVGPWLQDEQPGLGPLGGILTALRAIRKPLLVISCDLPLLGPATLEQLLATRREQLTDQVMTTFWQKETGFIEALVAVYEPEAEPLLEAARANGIYKLSRAIPFEKRLHIPYSQVDALPFFNVNYPADLALLRFYEQHGKDALQEYLRAKEEEEIS